MAGMSVWGSNALELEYVVSSRENTRNLISIPYEQRGCAARPLQPRSNQALDYGGSRSWYNSVHKRIGPRRGLQRGPSTAARLLPLVVKSRVD